MQVGNQQAVLEAGALDLDVVSQRELSLEVARGDAAIQEVLSLSVFRLSSVGTVRSTVSTTSCEEKLNNATEC
ncbi:hypothetical protein WN73_11795 [Bradyrhizobium sp. CCBAU 45394]|uniref:hypothetical protein n=1 Tax=Bradyrhizobium sp. CCBAU 45394 TaxID=1325087 RepID=UPI0023037B42|nr:hypothetical protein [Bradyrhizobium sp. CCBAU 45394]MDA9391341.1 hypothetical protein [Bradyrhizobium sp. CCBAU 45394]